MREHMTQEKHRRNCKMKETEEAELPQRITAFTASQLKSKQSAQTQLGVFRFFSLYLRSSLAFNSGFISFQASSSGLVRAVGFMWSRTVISFPCFHKS